MYNAQFTADLIKKLLLEKNLTGKQMSTDLGLGVNTLSNIRRGDVKNVETFNLIADYLSCSVDYLLGRTDNPKGTYSINNNTNISGTQNNVINGNIPSDCSDDQLLLDMIKELDIVDRSKIIIQIDEMKNKK